MYERIVVGTDGSDRAATTVRHAADLAKTCGARLVLVQGCGGPVVAAPLFIDAVAIDVSEIADACRPRLEALAAELRADGLDVDVDVRTESGHLALCNAAEAVSADLIVVGNRGMTGARRFLGSVPNSVAHQAPCSVLIVDTD